MSSWQHVLNRLGYRAETQFDRLRQRLRRRLGYQDRLQIVPYRGYGDRNRVTLQGRVLEDRGAVGAPGDDDNDNASLWDNILDAYRRFQSDEVPGVAVRAEFYGAVAETQTDEEGYFRFQLRPAQTPNPDRVWHPVGLSLPGRPGTVGGEVLIPPHGCRYGIISDVDDTILHTQATSLLRMAKLTFLQNAKTRLAFDGVAAFYQALTGGPGAAPKPLFFVSSSPWNLYDFLVDFMRLNGIPDAPIRLRDLGLEADHWIKAGHDEHKTAQIDHILQTYPQLPFVLIGDSGQHDPEIYADTVRRHPGRILAAYIRDVSQPPRDAEVRAISDQLRALGSEMVLAADTRAAAEHALSQNLIEARALPLIFAAAADDAGPPDTVERLVSG